MAEPLAYLKDFMQVHSAAIVTVLLGILGPSNLGKAAEYVRPSTKATVLALVTEDSPTVTTAEAQ